MDNMTQDEQINNHNMAIMNKLGDILISLAVNTNETQNIKNKVEEIKIDLKEVKHKVEFQNGRVRTLEDWSNEAKKIIENTTIVASKTASGYKIDKTRIWAVIGVLLFLGSTIIGLAIMAIDSKIKQGIQDALAEYETDK